MHHQRLGHVLPWDMLVAKSMGIRCVLHAHGSFLAAMSHEMPNLLNLPFSCSIADAVVCPNEADGQFWQQFVRRTYVMSCALSPRFVAEKPSRRSGHAVIWCGRIDEDKNPLDAAYVMGEVLKSIPDATLKMVGPWKDDMRAEVEIVAASVDAAGAIEFCGPRTQDELIQEYRQADVFLLTSHLEDWALALQEAKAAGLPCVAYDMPYLSFCAKGTGVLTAPMGYWEGLGRQVVRILQDDTLYERLANEAFAQAQEIVPFDHAGFWREVFAGFATMRLGGAIVPVQP